MEPHERTLLIRGARIYDHDGDIHDPPIRDILVVGSRIASVTAPGEHMEAKGVATETIEARGKLIIPGFVNAHYHSYDVLAKGLLEDMPFDVWALHSQPAYFGKRSKAEIRIRTLLGALECLRNGITTVQDMNSLVPQDEETLDTILSAYDEIGIRCATSPRSTSLPSCLPTCPKAPWPSCAAHRRMRKRKSPSSSGRSSASIPCRRASPGDSAPRGRSVPRAPCSKASPISPSAWSCRSSLTSTKPRRRRRRRAPCMVTMAAR
jgi:hypothetical protein